MKGFILFFFALLSLSSQGLAEVSSGSIFVQGNQCQILWNKNAQDISCSPGISSVYQLASVDIDFKRLNLTKPPICLVSPSYFLGSVSSPHISDFNVEIVTILFPNLGSTSPDNMIFNFICHI